MTIGELCPNLTIEMDSFIPCKFDFRLNVKSKDLIEVIRGPIGGKHECKITCKRDYDVWNIHVDLPDSDEFNINVINESGFPLQAITQLMSTYSRIAG